MRSNANFKKLSILSALLGTSAIVAAPQAALAQDAPQQTSVEEDGGGLDAIVVTARKVNESLIEVPIAISALSADDLDKRGIAGFQDLNDFVPGLRYMNSAANRNDRGFHTITMRGMYPGDAPNRQAVTVFVDGVPIPGGAIPGLTDIDQVEVVKGPQSAYFGRSTFAGAINFITRAPSLTDYSAKIEASYASFSTIEAQASIEAPIIQDRLGVRVSGRFFETDGQYKNTGRNGRLGDRKTQSIAVGIHAKPIDDLTIRGYFTYWEDSDGPSAQAALTEQDYNCNAGGNGRQVNGRNYVCGGISDIPLARIAQNTAPAGITDFTPITSRFSPYLPIDFIDHHGLERKEYQANITAEYNLNDWILGASFGSSRNRWAALTETYNRPPDSTGYYSTVLLPYNITNKSAEVRVSSPTENRFKFLVGGNYYQESIIFMTVAFRPVAGVPTVTNLVQPSDYRAKTFGLFGSASYELTEGLKLSAEGRYQWDTINHRTLIVNGLSPKATFKSFSPRVILNYEFDRNASVYLSWARGTRPGTFNATLSTLTPFQLAQVQAQFNVPLEVAEEKLTMYEAGLKGEFFDRRLRILAAAYYGQWRDRQISQNIAFLTTPGGSTTTTNTFTLGGGKTDIKGIELETAFKVTDAVTLEGTFNWAHSKILQTSCTECLAINGVLNPVGNSMERYPEFSGTAAVSYDAPISADWSLLGRIDAIYAGRQYDTAANTAWLNPSARVNARIGIYNDSYSLELFGRNIFDNKRPSNIMRNANPNALATQGLNLIILAAPERATFGVKGTARF